MRKSRKRQLIVAGAVAALLLLLALLGRGWAERTEPLHPGQSADGYVPCPAGTRPKPKQPHICVPD